MPGMCKDTAGAFRDDLFKKPIGTPWYSNTKDLNDTLAGNVSRVLSESVPRAHLLGQTRVAHIVRNKEWGDQASLYYPEKEFIEIKVPFKWQSNFLSVTKKQADSLYVTIATNRKSSAGSFWATSPMARHKLNDNLFDWVIRHEFGHAIDNLLQISNRLIGGELFGSWVRYQGASKLVQDMLLMSGAASTYGDCRAVANQTQAICEGLAERGGANWHSPTEWKKARSRELANANITHSNAAMQTALRSICALIDKAIDDPWLDGNAADNEFHGRRFHHMTTYGEWYSYSPAAYRKRISNYQFSAPSEWFAETYAAFFGAGTEFRNLLVTPADNAEIVRWFQDHLMPDGAHADDFFETNDGALQLKTVPQPTTAAPWDLEQNVPGSWVFNHPANPRALDYNDWFINS